MANGKIKTAVITGEHPYDVVGFQSMLRTIPEIAAYPQNMWDFVDRLCNVALPRVRDFRGVSPKAFDGRGNFTLGIREQIIFPEIDYDRIDKIKGMNVTFVTTAATDEEGRSLLSHLGMPFRK